MKSNSGNAEYPLKIFAIFFALFFLFNSGFIFELARDVPSSVSLDNTMDFPRFNLKEVYGARWLADKSSESFLYGDTYGSLLLSEFAFWNVRVFWGKTDNLPNDVYVFFRSVNVKGKIIDSPAYNYTSLWDSLFYTKIIIKKNKIYDNSGVEIFG